jgi:hypothetical protein
VYRHRRELAGPPSAWTAYLIDNLILKASQ